MGRRQRGNPGSNFTQPRPRTTAPPVGRHLDCFRSEHALLKIHKKGCGSAGCPPPHLMYCSYACLSRSLRLPICLVQVSHLAFIAHSRRNFLCAPLPSLLCFTLPDRGGVHARCFGRMGFENARLRATKPEGLREPRAGVENVPSQHS